MTIEVEHKDTTGTLHNRQISISRVGFVKHLAMAGQGYRFNTGLVFRALGMFLHYSQYLDRTSFYNNHFSQPPLGLSDPTEKGQFSNLAGKAIADLLSKKIDNSFYTINYEAAMRVNNIKIKGERPDLIAFSNAGQFAIESKGRVQTNPGNMATHKLQSKSGSISVHFTIASISYNLFTRVKCKYHDPFNGNIPYDSETLRETSRQYYQGFSTFLNNDYFGYEIVEYNNERFYEVYLRRRSLVKLLTEPGPRWPIMYLELFEISRPRLIVPFNVLELSENGLSRNAQPFLIDGDGLSSKNLDNANERPESFYIDADRIGLRIQNFE